MDTRLRQELMRMPLLFQLTFTIVITSWFIIPDIVSFFVIGKHHPNPLWFGLLAFCIGACVFMYRRYREIRDVTRPQDPMPANFNELEFRDIMNSAHRGWKKMATLGWVLIGIGALDGVILLTLRGQLASRIVMGVHDFVAISGGLAVRYVWEKWTIKHEALKLTSVYE